MNRRSVQFAVVFLLLLAGLSALIRMPFVLEGLRDPLCAALARAASGLLGVFGVETVVSGTQIRGATGVTEVVYNCDGVGLLVIFLSATLAFPVKRLASIAAGIAFGTLVILAINVVRIAFLAWLNLGYQDLVEFAHVYVFQGILVVVTVVTWLAWVTWAQRAEPPELPAT